MSHFMHFECNLDHLTERANTDGTFRYYFRRRGQPLTRLPGVPLSKEFMEAYQRCLDWTPPSAGQVEGTFAWLCDQYMASPAFTSKAEATRLARKRIIVSMMKEKMDPSYPDTFGQESLKHLKPVHIEILRDRKADNPNAANERLKILRQIFKLPVAMKTIGLNLGRDIENLEIPRGGHPTVTDEQLEQFFAFHKPGTNAHRGMTILKETGARVSDLRVLGRQHLRAGLLIFRTKKTDMLCELPISSSLQEAFGEKPTCDNLTFLLSDLQVPYESDKAMSARVAKWFRQAGIKVVTAHGVRKWLATKMAEAGATEWELCAWFGWKDPKEARPYVQAANRRKMAQTAHAKLGRV